MESLTTSNLGQFIIECTDGYRERPAFILKEAGGSRRPLSFFEFNETVKKIIQILRTRYPTGKFKIGLWGENRVEWCALAIATWYAGGTLVPLMHIATDSEIKNIIKAAKIDGLFISPKLGKKDISEVKDVFSMDFAQTRGASGVRSLGDLISDMRSGPQSLPNKSKDEVDVGGDNLAVLIFTSGTTGHPKGVMLTHKNIITNVLDTLDVFPIGKNDRAISVLPLSHLFELVGGFTICHLKGICITYPESLKPEDVLGEMKLHKATILVAVPLFFEIIDRAIKERVQKMSQLVQKIFSMMGGIVLTAPFLGRFLFKKLHAIFGGHIRFFVTGGAKIDADIILRFRRLGIHFLQGYGLTETSPIISFTPMNSDKFGSVGLPVPSIKVKIIEGEICVSGPTVFAGYFENPEATDQVIKDGWFHTGDIGEIDGEGFIYITGRKKDMIVTANGKNIYPEELEEAFKASTLIAEISIIGLDTGQGEEVHAVVVPSPQAPKDIRSQKQAIWSELDRIGLNFSDYKRVRGLTISQEELPKTATKKVRKHVLRESIAKGMFNSPQISGIDSPSHTPLDATYCQEVWLAERLKLLTKRDEIWKEAHLRQDLGLGSLTFMELIGSVEVHWGIHVADDEINNILTVQDLLAKIADGAGSPIKVSNRADFDYKKNNRFLMRTLRLLLHILVIRPVFRIFFRFRTFGSQIFKQSKNWIVTPNHSSHLDLLAILASVPLSRLNSTYAVAADDYFFNHPAKAYFVRLLFNAIPFERRARIDKSFRVCEAILKDGGNLIIFPEGTRSPSGQLAEFKAGVGRLLASQKYPAIPAFIKGAHEAFPKGALLPRPHAMAVYVGNPVNFSSLKSDTNGYQVVAFQLHGAVEDLKYHAQVQGLK
jgi:long-chain acyl-CoA synthetase